MRWCPCPMHQLAVLTALLPLLMSAVAGAFGTTFDDLWDDLPPLQDIKKILKEWGVYDDGLEDVQYMERYCRFEGVEFGIAPLEKWPSMRRDLL